MQFKLFKAFISCICLLSVLVCCDKPSADDHSPPMNYRSQSSLFRSYEEAEELAKDLLYLSHLELTRSTTKKTIISGDCYTIPQTKSSSQIDTVFYVFNFSNGEGFAIIAGNRQVSPLIAITDKGTYTPGEKTGVDGFDDYMDMVVSSLQEIDRNEVIPYSYYEDVVIGSQISPLVSVKWGQNSEYGQYCPNGISGCVITATAQIMSYLEKPESIVLSVDMGDDYAAGDSLSLDWPSIKEHVISHTDSTSCNAVHKQIGALMRELGFLYNANYQPTGTSASTSNAVNIYSHFGINCSEYSTADIEDIKNSLLIHRPVHMRGATDNNEGHSFIADGYRDIEVWRIKYALPVGEQYIPVSRTKVSESHCLHINWGWDGVCNGYFSFASYNTALGEEYDTAYNYANYDFCNNVRMIHNIWKPAFPPLPLPLF